MSKFIFKTDAKSEEFCLEIVSIMIDRFQITEDEAVGRINRYWRKVCIIEEYDLIHHELPETWAYHIYFGPDSQWWKKDTKNLTPIPYP